MSTVFYIDQNKRAAGGGILPAPMAIPILRGQTTTNRAFTLWGSLIDLAGGERGYGRSINLRGRDAVLMMGTTPELQAAVEAASADGVNGVSLPDDYLVIYYLRYEEPGTFMGTTDRTIACIAGWQHYWGLSPDSQDDTNVRNAGWDIIYPNAGDDWIFNGSMPLMPPSWPNLHGVLGRAHHIRSWYNERGARIR
jgi:hypothetical protein